MLTDCAVGAYRNVKIGYALREYAHAHSTCNDGGSGRDRGCGGRLLPTCGGRKQRKPYARVAAYPDHFWLLVNTDDDNTPFPSRVEDGTLVGFVDGMATNEPNLADAMYDDADMHDEHGVWQMIFGVDVAPVYQHRGCASYLLRQVILDAAQAGRKGLVLTCKERLVDFLRTAGIRGRRTVRVDAWQRGSASDEARADARRQHGKPLLRTAPPRPRSVPMMRIRPP